MATGQLIRRSSQVRQWLLPVEASQRGRRDVVSTSLLLSLVAVAVVELFVTLGAAPPNLTILLAVVVFVALRGGRDAGLVCAVVVSVYGLHFFSLPGRLFDYGSDPSRVPILSATALVIGVLVGDLREDLDRARIVLASQLHFRQAMDDSLADGVYAIDRVGRATLVNPAASRMLGWSESELRGRPMHDVIHHTRPDGSPFPASECPGLQVLDIGTRFVTEDDAFIRKDGTMIAVAYSSAPIVIDGAIAGAVVAFRDISERKAAEKALRDSEGKLRLMAQQVPAHLWTTDRNLHVTTVSGSIASRLGIDPDRYIGRRITDTTRPLKQPPSLIVDAHLSALGGGSGGYTIETDGAIFEARVEPLLDLDRRVVGCIGLALDVTERHRSDQRRQTLYEVSRVLASVESLEEGAAPILGAAATCLGWTYGALWVVDRRDNCLRCAGDWSAPSTACPNLSLVNGDAAFAPSEGIPGRAWSTKEPVWLGSLGDPPETPRLAVAAMDGLRAGFAMPIVIGRDVVGVIEFFGHEQREADTDEVAMVTALGQQLGQFVERKQAEHNLRMRAEQQAAVASLGQRALGTMDLADLFDEAVQLVSATLRVEFSSLLELLPDGSSIVLRTGIGWRPGLVGRATAQGETDSQAGYTLRAGAPVLVEDLRKERRFSDPTLLHDHHILSGISVPIPTGTGWFGVLGAHTKGLRTFSEQDVGFMEGVALVLGRAVQRRILEEDLAEEKAASRIQREESARLASLNELRSGFIQSVSHDLRTPLTASRAGLGLLEASAGARLHAEECNLLANVRRNVERLRTLIDDLLLVSQIDSGMLVLDHDPLDLRDVVANAASSIDPLVREKGQSLRCAIADPLLVEGDTGQLERAVVNLLANANTHTPEGTEILVTAHRHDGLVALSVSDDGPGIADEELEAIFARFHRLTPANSGSGLGLTIARSVVELHGGQLWAGQRPGGGAQFHLELPALGAEVNNDA